MTDNILALRSILTAALIALFVYGPWQWYATDSMRHTLFVQRNRLFDIANCGRVGFDSEAYRGLRSHIESLIRFGHNLTLPGFLYFWARADKLGLLGKPSHLLALIESIEDPSVRDDFLDVYDRCGRRVVFMLVEKSFFLTTLLSLFHYTARPAFLSIRFGRQAKGWLAQKWRSAAQAANELPVFDAVSPGC